MRGGQRATANGRAAKDGIHRGVDTGGSDGSEGAGAGQSMDDLTSITSGVGNVATAVRLRAGKVDTMSERAINSHTRFGQ